MLTTDHAHRSSTGTWLGAAALLQFGLPWVLSRLARRAPDLDAADCRPHAAH